VSEIDASASSNRKLARLQRYPRLSLHFQKRIKMRIGDTSDNIGAGSTSGIPGKKPTFTNALQPQQRGEPSAQLGGLAAAGRRSPLSFLHAVTGKDENAPPPQAVLLDLDGTLVDSAKFQAVAWVLLCREQFNLTLEPHEADALTGSNPEIVMMLAKRAGKSCTPQEAKVLADRRDEIFRELIERNPIHARDGVHDFLTLAQEKKVPFAIVTNSVAKNAGKLLRQTRLDQYFPDRLVVTVDEVPAKPNPKGYRTGAARLGQRADVSFVLDDTKAGVDASEGAQTWATGIVNDTMEREAFGPTPEGRTRVFTDFPELAERWSADRRR
jgi:beta-phosphoglucomutase